MGFDAEALQRLLLGDPETRRALGGGWRAPGGFRGRGAGGAGARRAGVDFVDRWLRSSDNLAPHLLLVGRTGAGKTTAARTLLLRAIRQHFYDIVVLDWDAEYLEVPLPVFTPPFRIAAPPPLVADALAEVERAEEGGHMVAAHLRKALAAAPSLEKAAERLRADISLSVTPLRGVLEAAAARLEIVAKHVEFVPLDALPQPGGLQEGIYLLSEIASIWERASIQQFLAVFHTLARRSPIPPSLLVVEEGGMGARTTFLRHLLALARRRNIRLIFVTQGPLLSPELRQNFEVLLFDSDPELRRALRAAIPDGNLEPGECWHVRRDGTAKKLRFKR
jgi:DNA polymerase III delta prime subunit